MTTSTRLNMHETTMTRRLATSQEASPTASYAFDIAWRQARQRLAAIEAWLDPGPIRHLQERAVGAGWRCLEVSAGGLTADCHRVACNERMVGLRLLEG